MTDAIVGGLQLTGYMAQVGRAYARRAGEIVAREIAWRLPHTVVMWAGIRMAAHASAVLPTTEMNSISPADMLKAWGDVREKDVA